MKFSNSTESVPPSITYIPNTLSWVIPAISVTPYYCALWDASCCNESVKLWLLLPYESSCNRSLPCYFDEPLFSVICFLFSFDESAEDFSKCSLRWGVVTLNLTPDWLSYLLYADWMFNSLNCWSTGVNLSPVDFAALKSYGVAVCYSNAILLTTGVLYIFYCSPIFCSSSSAWLSLSDESCISSRHFSSTLYVRVYFTCHFRLFVDPLKQHSSTEKMTTSSCINCAKIRLTHSLFISNCLSE